MKKHTIIIYAFIVSALTWSSVGDVAAQDYLLGAEQNQLEMIVHIIGEVKRPGEYRVSDNTSILELLSKAGGPTEFSNLSKVSISRVQHAVSAKDTDGGSRLREGNKIIKVNIDSYLKKNNSTPPPMLQPGDVVLVARNSWSKWRNMSTIFRDVSVVFSLYFLYLRIDK